MNWRRYIPLIIVVAGVIAYHDSFDGKFVFDDGHSIVENQRIHQLWPPWLALSDSSRPLVQLSLAVNYAIGKLNPWGYHLFNLIVHLLAGLTLYGVARRTLARVWGDRRSHGSALDLQSDRALETSLGGTCSVTSSADTDIVGQAPRLAESDNKATAATGAVALHGEMATAAGGAPALQFSVVSLQSSVISPSLAIVLAGIIALIWVVHPLNTQAVTYIIQRGESMMGLFYLITLYCFIRGVEASEALTSDLCSSGRSVSGLWSPVSGLQRSRFLWFAATIAACSAGMLCKEVMFTAPAMVLFYDRLFVAQSWKTVLRVRWSFYVLLFMTCAMPLAITFGNKDPNHSAGFEMASLSVQGYALTQPSVILHYLRLAVRPVGLCFDYLWPVAQGFWQIVPPLMVVSGFFVLTLSLFCRYSALAFPGLWFFGILSITSSIMPIADLAVEHRMYLPLIAPIVLMVVGCHRLLVRTVGRRASTVGLAGVSAVVMCLSSLTIERNAIYHTEERFWTDVLAKRPLNFRAHVTLASISTKEKHFSEAKMHYRRTIDIISFMPGHFQASRHLGTAHFHLGHYNRALPLLTRTLATVTRKEDLHNMIGLIDLRQGRLTEAADHFTEAVRLSPIVLEYQFNRGLAEMRRRRFDVAETAFRSAVEIDPHDAPSHHGLAKTLWHQGKSGNAIASWKSAIAIDPKYWPSVYDLAWVMATHPNPRLRNGIESFRLATRIVDDSKNPDALALEILAAAYAENGNFSEAVNAQEKSLSMSFDDGGTIVIGTERDKRLESYRTGKPWRMEATNSQTSKTN